jgi:RluA family pseudouridine synthase
VAKPKHIELPNGLVIPIVYEDRAVMAIDKPEGWLLAPDTWDHTGRNLQLAIESSMNARDFWAQSRNLKFLRYIHRLDADTTGLLLMAKSTGAVRAFSELFETQQVSKSYLAVVRGAPKQPSWTCQLPLGPHPFREGLMVVDEREGKEAETKFTVVQAGANFSLVLAEPRTGRTHQIRVHLAEAGHPVLNDRLYSGEGSPAAREQRDPMALRAFRLSYIDPFRRVPARIEAPSGEFLKRFGFAGAQGLLRRENKPEGKGGEAVRKDQSARVRSEGTAENSPAFQRRVATHKRTPSRRDG